MKAAVLLLALLAFQDPAPKPAEQAVDRILLQDLTELRGEIVELTREGRIRIKLPRVARPLDLGIEEALRLRFSTDETRPAKATGEQIRLSGGGSLSGRVSSFDGEVAILESASGPVKLRRGDIRALLLGTPLKPLPEVKDQKKDVMLHEVEQKNEDGDKMIKVTVADYGRLRSIGDTVTFVVTIPATADAKERDEERHYERAAVKHLYLLADPAASEAPSGFFSKVTLKNGDRWVGSLQGISGTNVRLFSHALGSVTLEKSQIYSLAFIQQAQLTAGNILVNDPSGLHEFDARGREIWSYNQGVQAAAVARKLRNGNVLVADPTTNSVIEIHPTGRSGGDIVWRIDDIQNPCDAQRLENGNTLVAERYSNRVAEYDAKTREVIWQVPTQSPMAAQRLENGNTLITTNSAVFEVDASRSERWRANLRAGAIRPHTASRLDNGNTLITDLLRGQVVEIDPQSAQVWSQTGLLRPVQAVRLEDGNTLILEQGANRVVEVDPTNLRTEIINRGLNAPQGMSTY